MGYFVLTDSDDVFPGSRDDNSGRDFIFGGLGNDLIHGGDQVDHLIGGAGRDTLHGDAGDDLLIEDAPENDHLDGGEGIDGASLYFVPADPTDTPVDVRAEVNDAAWSVLVNGVAAVSLISVERLSIVTGDGNDLVAGWRFGDSVETGGGHDRVRTGAGDDFVSKTFGRYELDGGVGTDSLTVSDTRPSDAGAGLIFDARGAVGLISSGTDTTGTFQGFEYFNVTGTSVGDRIFLAEASGGSLRNTVLGGRGNDLIVGGAGADVLDGDGTDDFPDRGADTLFGGAGNDNLTVSHYWLGGGGGADHVFAGTGDDLITFYGSGPAIGAQVFVSFDGAVFEGQGGYDRLRIGTGSNSADLTGALVKGIESLTHYDHDGQQVLRMTAEQLDAITDIDAWGAIALTTAGDVVLAGDLSVGRIRLAEGGQMIDLAATTRRFDSQGTEVRGGGGHDIISGTERGERLQGLGGNDQLFGTGGSDTIIGDAGDDRIVAGQQPLQDYHTNQLHGGEGRDTVVGGQGNDTISGGAGADILTGLGAADVFDYFSAVDSGTATVTRDTITDFTVNPAAGGAYADRIDLSRLDARASTAANDAFQFIGTASFTAEGQIRVSQSGANTAVYINTAGAGTGEMSILLLNVNASLLSASDFIL